GLDDCQPAAILALCSRLVFACVRALTPKLVSMEVLAQLHLLLTSKLVDDELPHGAGDCPHRSRYAVQLRLGRLDFSEPLVLVVHFLFQGLKRIPHFLSRLHEQVVDHLHHVTLRFHLRDTPSPVRCEELAATVSALWTGPAVSPSLGLYQE